MRSPIIIAVAFLALVATPAVAQDGTRRVTLGLGVQARPSFPGARKLSLAPLPFIRARRPGTPLPVRTPDQSPGFRLFGEREGISIGPVLNFQTKRNERDVGAPVGNVGFTVEPGLFFQAFLRRDLRVRIEARHGIGGHDAFVGDAMADYVLRPSNNRFVATIGPRLRVGDARYERAYFGVTPRRAVATGLPVFSPGAGIYSVGAGAGILYQITPAWGAYGYAGYDRLTGDAADSPIVRRLGSRNQYSVGLAATYSFDLKL